MSVEDKKRIYRLADRLNMRFHHFAKGTYPCFSRTRFTVNRLILVLENPNGEKNYIEDAAERRIMHPGSFCLAPAFHDVIFQFDETIRFFSIHFNLELFPGIDLFSTQKRLFEGPATNALIRAEHAFSDTAAAEAAAAVELHTLTFEIISCCLEQMEESTLELVSKFAPYQEVIDYIASHCTALVSVEELAELMHMRRDVFTRKFTADTGIPPKRFFHRMLIDRATRLLRRPDITAREVALELKFSSEYYFSRFFKQHLGISPHRFQQQYRIRQNL